MCVWEGVRKGPPRKEGVGLGGCGQAGVSWAGTAGTKGKTLHGVSEGPPAGNNVQTEAGKRSRPSHGGLEFYPEIKGATGWGGGAGS